MNASCVSSIQEDSLEKPLIPNGIDIAKNINLHVSVARVRRAPSPSSAYIHNDREITIAIVFFSDLSQHFINPIRYYF